MRNKSILVRDLCVDACYGIPIFCAHVID